jgi:hypothetical protein
VKKQTVKLSIIMALLLAIIMGYVIYTQKNFHNRNAEPLPTVEKNQSALMPDNANANSTNATDGETLKALINGQAEQKAGALPGGSPEKETGAGPGSIAVEKKVGEKAEPADVTSQTGRDKIADAKSAPTGGGDAHNGGAEVSSEVNTPRVASEKDPAADGGDAIKDTDSTSAGAGECRVEIAVVGRESRLLYGPATVAVKENNRWGLTALGALDSTGIEYKTSLVYGGFVISIAGQANKGMSGWMYSVNNQVPMAAASEKKIKPGDRIIWWYSESVNNPSPSWESLVEKLSKTPQN